MVVNMDITLNGETRDVPAESTIADLVENLQLAGKRFAVEINQQIIPRSMHATHRLNAQDRVEIVHAIGGG